MTNDQHAWRTYAAAAPDIAQIRVPEDQEALTGQKPPHFDDTMGCIRYNILLEAKLRAIYADVMLAEEKKRFHVRQDIDPLAGTSNDYQTGE